MKTVDIIPLILFELNSGDKYGIELSKNIETKTKGQVEVKQPTLYTVLRKLEKSKFISSYWVDSDIGGKRHYYKITENGKHQLETLPPYEDYLNQVFSTKLTSETDEANAGNNDEALKSDNNPLFPQSVSIMDNLSVENSPNQEETLPKEEIFNSNEFSRLTTAEINQQNIELLKDNSTIESENFASNTSVTKFTETPSTPSIVLNNEVLESFKNKNIEVEKLETDKIEIKKNNYEETLNKDKFINEDFNDVKYIDFVQFQNTPEYISAKKNTKIHVFKSCLTALYLLIFAVISAVVVREMTHNSIYFVSLILAVGCIIFYPILVLCDAKKYNQKLKNNEIKNNFKFKLVVSLIIILIVIILLIIINVLLLKLNFAGIFKFSNIGNFYFPVLFSTSIVFDCLIEKLLTK